MVRAGKDAFAAVVYTGFCSYLFYSYAGNFEGFDYLVGVNCCFGAFGCYLLSKRWVAGLGGRFFAGAVFGFAPFMFFLGRFHSTAGSFAAIFPWLFLPAVFGPGGKRRWLRIPMAIFPFVAVAVLFRFAAMLRLYPLPVQLQIRPVDMVSIFAPAAMVTQVDVLVGFYHIPIAALIIGTAMLLAARRYSVVMIFAAGVLLAVFDSYSGAPRIIWLTVPLLCCSVLIGEGTEGIMHCSYSDRRWILTSAAVLLVCAIIALLFGTKATHVFAGLGARHTRGFIEAAQMYMVGAIAIGVVFFFARGKSRLMWLRATIISSATAVDIFLGARSVVDAVF